MRIRRNPKSIELGEKQLAEIKNKVLHTEQVKSKPKLAYTTNLGKMYQGKCEAVLQNKSMASLKGKVQLILTSPPFPLNRKKRYGNFQGEEYLEWLSSLAPLFREFLTPKGSIVIEVGNAWVAKSPTMSTLPIKSLLSFQEKGKFFLCQEFVCFNPARLPSPAQWVTVNRERVKDAFTRAWWMSKGEHPKADNRRILLPYSKSMQELLKRGTYNVGPRPSEHHIGKKTFLRNNGGSIPPNVLIPKSANDEIGLMEILPVSNTRSTDPYLAFCKTQALKPHPARMPEKLAEFFITFLTDKNDFVMDPFGGSNITGYVAERLGRKWISIEAKEEYAYASAARFSNGKKG